MANRKLKWVLIKVLERKIWIKREEIVDVQIIGYKQNKTSSPTNIYKIVLSDRSIIPQCELESDKIYQELIKKDLTKKR